MNFIFDPQKDATNAAKHGVSLATAALLDWDTALIWPDLRKDYGEIRYGALAEFNGRLYFVAYTDIAEGRRVISLRRANRREVIRYEKENSQTF